MICGDARAQSQLIRQQQQQPSRAGQPSVAPPRRLSLSSSLIPRDHFDFLFAAACGRIRKLWSASSLSTRTHAPPSAASYSSRVSCGLLERFLSCAARRDLSAGGEARGALVALRGGTPVLALSSGRPCLNCYCPPDVAGAARLPRCRRLSVRAWWPPRSRSSSSSSRSSAGCSKASHRKSEKGPNATRTCVVSTTHALTFAFSFWLHLFCVFPPLPRFPGSFPAVLVRAFVCRGPVAPTTLRCSAWASASAC